MTKPTQREIARLLATRATLEPPAGLAERIKAEIPGSIRLDRRTYQPGRRWLMPPLIEGLHPSWLVAASVLLVAGMGMVAARIPSQPDDVWKWMALSGVVHIDDIVVTAPAPAESHGIAVAMAQPRASKGFRIPVPARQKIAASRAGAPEQGARAAVSDAAGRASLRGLPPGEYRVRSEAQGFEPDEKKVEIAAGATAETGVTMPKAKMAEEAAVRGGAPVTPTSAQAAAAMSRPSRVQARGGIGKDENSVTVVILDEAERPCEGVTVTLERLGQGAFETRTARTDSGGTATFRGVPPASYRALAAAPSIAPAQVIVAVASERASTRVELHVRALSRH